MANATIDKIVEQIEGLTAMELADLSKAIQDKFGVTAAAPVAFAGPAAGAAGAEAAVPPRLFTASIAMLMRELIGGLLEL